MQLLPQSLQDVRPCKRGRDMRTETQKLLQGLEGVFECVGLGKLQTFRNGTGKRDRTLECITLKDTIE
jgi:hypothetical protein